MPDYDVIVMGSATQDVLLKSNAFRMIADRNSETGQLECLPLGAKVEVEKMVITSGGGGTNVAVTFARQGYKTACVGVVGDDIPGSKILAELEHESVETRYFQKHADDYTAYSTILVHDSGERTILSYKGEGQHWDIAKIPFDDFDAEWLYLDSLGGNFELFQKAVELGKLKGMKIAANPGKKELTHGLEKLKPILANLDIFIVNKEEAALLLGNESSSHESTISTLHAFIPGISIVTDGPRGVRLIDAAGIIYEAGTPNAPRIEATGAGDAFGSGFVAQYVRSMDVVKAIQYATANATSVVGQYGAKAGILKKGDWGPWPKIEVIQH